MALTATERKIAEEAVKTLSHYNKSPFISNFLKQQPKPRIPIAKYEKAELCDLIRSILLEEYRGKKGYKLKVEDLIAYLDSLQETGRQHLYLFNFSDEDRAPLLDRLKNEIGIKQLIGGEADLYAQGRKVLETSDGPELALVRYDQVTSSKPGKLILKWVETRSYWAPQHAQPSDSENIEESGESVTISDDETEGTEERERIQIRVKHEERAVTFWVVDLQTGRSELRIQALHGRSRVDRQSQLDKYRSLISSLFGIELVGPLVMAPAVRRALTAGEVTILACSAILPDGGRFIGGRGQLPPVDVSRLQAGVTVRFEWAQQGAGVSRIELDGRLDEIFTLRPLLPEQHGLVVDLVRRWRREGLAATTVIQDQSQPQVEPQVFPTEEVATSADAQISPTTRDNWALILKTALRQRQEQIDSAIEPAIDRAIREYVRTHAIEETVTSVSEDKPQEKVTSHVITEDPRPLEQFLTYIKEVAQTERLTYQKEIKLIRGEERWYSRLFIAAAVVALAIVTTSAFLLIFVPDSLTIGTVTGILGALTGRGSVLIRSYAKNLKGRRESIQDQQRDSRQTLLAIQTALSIPDTRERSAAMTSAAAILLARVVSTPAVSE